jgi:hypothetical protein
MWYIYIIEYYSALKKNEIMLIAEKWKEVEVNMSSKINHIQKDKYLIFSHICGI